MAVASAVLPASDRQRRPRAPSGIARTVPHPLHSQKGRHELQVKQSVQN